MNYLKFDQLKMAWQLQLHLSMKSYNSSFLHILSIVIMLFQFETSYSDNLLSNRQKVSSLTNQLNTKANFTKQFDLQRKTYQGLQQQFQSKQYLQKLGPGITGGGSGCAQQLAHSFDFLYDIISDYELHIQISKLVNNNFIRVDNKSIIEVMNHVQIRFGNDLKINDQSVEMLNVPNDHLILVDPKVCLNRKDYLNYFTPLFLHEVLSILKVENEKEKYSYSNRYRSKINAILAERSSNRYQGYGTYSLSNDDILKFKSQLIKLLIQKCSNKHNKLDYCNFGNDNDYWNDLGTEDLIFLPVAETFDVDKDNQGQWLRRTEYYSFLVSGIIVHHGNASGGGSFTNLLHVEAKIESSYVENKPAKYSLDIVDQRFIGETFDFNSLNH